MTSLYSTCIVHWEFFLIIFFISVLVWIIDFEEDKSRRSVEWQILFQLIIQAFLGRLNRLLGDNSPRSMATKNVQPQGLPEKPFSIQTFSDDIRMLYYMR
jgi:hypothetical protein